MVSGRSIWRRRSPGPIAGLLTSADRFFWSSPALTRTGPHIRDANSVQRLWNYFVIASLPAWLIGLWSLGRQNAARSRFDLGRDPEKFGFLL